jgi:hypothetical protein
MGETLFVEPHGCPAGRQSMSTLTAEPGEHRLEHRQQRRHALGTDDEIPEPLELLPPSGIGDMAQRVAD